MATRRRTVRLNSLLQEVISEVIHKAVRDPRLASFVSVTQVEITSDLHHAKVFISVLGSPQEQQQSLEALRSAAGFIAVQASKKMVIRSFPTLTFHLDTSAERQVRMETLLTEIREERELRTQNSPPAEDPQE